MKRFFNNIVVKFILITLVFFIITSPIVVLFGPFGNLKRAVVVGAGHVPPQFAGDVHLHAGRRDHALTASAVHHVALRSGGAEPDPRHCDDDR